MKRSVTVLATILLLISMAFVSCKKDDKDKNTITMENSKFSPVTLTIAPGTTVTWKNEESVTHEVISNDGLFQSGDLSDGASYSYLFSSAGTFYYHCKYTYGMTGSVVVQ